MGLEQSKISVVNMREGEGRTNFALSIDDILFSEGNIVKITSVKSNVEHKPINQLDENVLALPNETFVIEFISSEQFKWTDGLNIINVHKMHLHAITPKGRPNSRFDVLITKDRLVISSGNGRNDYVITLEKVNQ